MNDKKKFLLILSIGILVFGIISSIIGPTPLNTSNIMKIAVFHITKGGGMYIIVFAVFFFPYLIVNNFTKEKKTPLNIAITTGKLSYVINALMWIFVWYGSR